MSIKYLNWAWNQNLDTPLQKLILVKLGDNADDTGRAFPALKHIAKFTSCNEKTVRRNVDALEKLLLLTVHKQPARGGHLRNEYQLHYEIVLHFDSDKLLGTEPTTGQKVHQLPDTESAGYRTESPDNPQSLTPSINHNNTFAKKPAKAPCVPYQQIVDLYNQILGSEFRGVIKIDVTGRKAKIKKFWHDMGNDISECERYFNYFRDHAEPWQKGMTERKWTADIDYIVKDTTVEKMRAG